MYDYWNNRANRLKVDIEHIKRQEKLTSDPEELLHLKQLKQTLTAELMIALEALDKFSA